MQKTKLYHFLKFDPNFRQPFWTHMHKFQPTGGGRGRVNKVSERACRNSPNRYFDDSFTASPPRKHSLLWAAFPLQRLRSIISYRRSFEKTPTEWHAQGNIHIEREICLIDYEKGVTVYESWTTLLLNPTLLKDESLWSSHWCLIRTHHNYP